MVCGTLSREGTFHIIDDVCLNYYEVSGVVKIGGVTFLFDL